jgi:hypothetical protein
VAELQHLEVGQPVPMGSRCAHGDELVSGREVRDRPVAALGKAGQHLGVWRLTDLGGGHTRLVTRVHAAVDWRYPVTAILGMVLMEFGDFAMMRRMRLGFGERAESLHRRLGS